MPYSNLPDDPEIQDKMERCVTKVMEGGKEKEAAIAICYAAIVNGDGEAEKAVKDAGFILDIPAGPETGGKPEAVKAPPEGHEFYGNQYSGGGGGSDGGNPSGVNASTPKEAIEKLKSGEKLEYNDATGRRVAASLQDNQDSTYRMRFFDVVSGEKISFRDYQSIGEVQKFVDDLFNAETVNATNEAFSRNKSLKSGSRHSATDRTHLRNAIDEIIQAGGEHERIRADELPAEIPIMDPEKSAVTFGGQVKAVKLDDGSVKFYGPLVTFSDENTPDLTGDFFTKETDFGDAQVCDVFFNHRMPIVYDGKKLDYKARLGKAKLTYTDAAIFAEAILKAHNEYEQAIIDAGLAGNLGWSSGTASHLVDREHTGKAYQIKTWILGLDASLTPTPAEPRNLVIPLKSLLTSDNNTATAPATDAPEAVQTAASDAGSATAEPTQPTTKGVDKMEMTDELKAVMASVAENAAADAVKKFRESEPAKPADVVVTKDESEQPFESAGHFLKAVRHAATDPSSNDVIKLRSLKATGMSEGVPADGGYLIPPQYASGIWQRMYETGKILSRVANDPVQGNSMTYNALAETSRADGYRSGGLYSYWLAEGATKTSSKPAFRQVELKLKKEAVLCYATDEQLEDTPNLESWLYREVPKELVFRAEDAIVNGDAVGKPRGLLNQPCLVTQTRVNASTVIFADVAGMWARRWSSGNYVWLIDPSVGPQLWAMTAGSYTAAFLPPTGLSGAMYGTLFGAPVIETEYNAAMGTIGDIILVDLSQYQVITKGGVKAGVSPHVAWTTDEQCYRFVYRIDGTCLWQSALTPKNGGNTLGPIVALSTAS